MYLYILFHDIKFVKSQFLKGDFYEKESCYHFRIAFAVFISGLYFIKR